MQTERNCVLVGLWGENCKVGRKFRLQEIVYWWGCGGENCKGEGSADCKKLCTGGIVGENCKREVSADCKNLCTGGIVGRIVMGEGSADCKKLCTGGIMGGEL